MNALIVEDCDNVVVAVEAIKKGTKISYLLHNGSIQSCCALNDITIYHKVAIQDIPMGGKIVKYGECIGVASVSIKKGEHVHVHNVTNVKS